MESPWAPAEELSAQHFHPSCPTWSRTSALTEQDSPRKEASESSSHINLGILTTLSPSSHALLSTPSSIHHQPSMLPPPPFPLPSPHRPYPFSGSRGCPHFCPQEPQPVAKSCSQVPFSPLGKHRSSSYKPAPCLPTYS